jgi:proline iminopeptidase
MNQLFPELFPFNDGFLKVSQMHSIYFEECGNPDGVPVIFVHGGPGGGLSPKYRQFFDPKKWRVILFDQRGCGKSRPFAELEENTTWNLIADMEAIREQLKIDRWVVFGGSWGSTLGISYAIEHTQRCLGLVLRGIFLLRKKEIDWFYQSGASKIFPDAWEDYVRPIPKEKRENMLEAFYEQLTSEDLGIRMAAAKAWCVWEGSCSSLIPNPEVVNHFENPEVSLAMARIECHYFMNKGFFDSDNYLIENLSKIRKVPCTIVQGRYDIVCPIDSAWELHKAWPESELQIIPDGGHSALDPKICSALINVVESMYSQVERLV